MKDVFDMVTDVRSLLNVSAITSLIDGGIYPSIRPDGSVKTDIVINGLGITNSQDQVGAGNINIYVPKIKVGGVMVADQARMSALGKSVSASIDAVYKPKFRLFLDGPAEPVRDTDGSYYVNIRYKYYSLQDEQVEI